MEAETQAPEVPRVKLGSQGLEVSRLGLGCLQLAGLFDAPLSDEEGIAVIKQAFDRGITFFDTADRYGPHKNEILIGKALKQLPGEKVQAASKFGIVKLEGGVLKTNGKAECVRASCEASLDRLGVEYIDLYYQDRVDLTVRIEDTGSTDLCIICFRFCRFQLGELKKLVEEGKAKYIGPSEASPDTIRRAHAVHPIPSLLCRWSGLSGPATSKTRQHHFAVLSPYRFSEDNLENMMAAKHGCSPAQPALAWLLHQGNDVGQIQDL